MQNCTQPDPEIADDIRSVLLEILPRLEYGQQITRDALSLLSKGKRLSAGQRQTLLRQMRRFSTLDEESLICVEVYLSSVGDEKW